MNIKNLHNKENLISLLFILLTVIFWGISFISTKIILAEIPPSSIAFFRQLIALIPLIITLFITKSFSKISLKSLLMISFSGFFGIVLYFVFENTGIKYTTASNASIIVAAVPVFTLISEIFIFKLRPNFKIISCIILSILGVYFVISDNGKLDFSSSTLLGNILVMGAMISWVIYTIMNKKLNDKHPILLLLFYQTLTSSFLFIPFVIPEIPLWKPMTLIPILNLIYLGVFCSALAYFMFMYAAKRLGPTVSSAFLNVIPVVSVITGFIILDETLIPLQLFGMFLIMLSLFQLSK